MKLSVSVPDDLWVLAKRRVDDDSPSAVVQAALTAFGGGGPGTDYAVRPTMDEPLAADIEAARSRLVAEARDLFQQGYRGGVELAGRLNFHQLDYIVRRGAVDAAKSMAGMAWDIDMGRAPEGAKPLIDPNVLLGYLGSYADYTGGEFETPTRPTVEGIDRALADVWERVNAPADVGESTPEHG
jgi:hypothetical protein